MDFKKVTTPEIDDLEVMSSPSEIKQFISSSLYQDFINELDIRLEMLTTLLDDFDLQATGRAYDMYRGGKLNILQMKELFPDMLENKINDLDTGKEEENA